jgi:hypothetical protein
MNQAEDARRYRLGLSRETPEYQRRLNSAREDFAFARRRITKIENCWHDDGIITRLDIAWLIAEVSKQVGVA